jgi:hypothetical protein
MPSLNDLEHDCLRRYLECGRQLSPQFFSEARLAEPECERTRAFLERVEADAVTVWDAQLHRAAQPMTKEEALAMRGGQAIGELPRSAPT